MLRLIVLLLTAYSVAYQLTQVPSKLLTNREFLLAVVYLDLWYDLARRGQALALRLLHKQRKLGFGEVSDLIAFFLNRHGGQCLDDFVGCGRDRVIRIPLDHVDQVV